MASNRRTKGLPGDCSEDSLGNGKTQAKEYGNLTFSMSMKRISGSQPSRKAIAPPSPLPAGTRMPFYASCSYFLYLLLFLSMVTLIANYRQDAAEYPSIGLSSITFSPDLVGEFSKPSGYIRAGEITTNKLLDRNISSTLEEGLLPHATEILLDGDRFGLGDSGLRYKEERKARFERTRKRKLEQLQNSRAYQSGNVVYEKGAGSIPSHGKGENEVAKAGTVQGKDNKVPWSNDSDIPYSRSWCKAMLESKQKKKMKLENQDMKELRRECFRQQV